MSPAPEESAVVAVERLIREAERVNASDIHLQIREGGADVALRLDGVLAHVEQVPLALAEQVVGRIKFLSRLKTYQDSLPQDGRIDRASVHAKRDIRVATYPTVTGEKIVLRLFNAAEVRDLSALDFPENALEQLKAVLARNSGLLLLTGPAGSGKTSTIYACLNHLRGGDMQASQGAANKATRGRHIITIEDPVEQVLPGIMQTEVNEAMELDFARAARHLLRQDPEVLVVGEIRDEETAGIAVRAALTGHLIISTLHAGSCVGVFDRLLALSPDRSAVVSAISLVVNQRLVRRMCQACGGKGCADCLQSGFRGRVPIVEWLRIGPAEREALRENRFQALRPPVSLLESGLALAAQNVTTENEIRRVVD